MKKETLAVFLHNICQKDFFLLAEIATFEIC